MRESLDGQNHAEKIKEIKTLFKNHEIEAEILSLKDIGFNEEIDENGSTFEENSYIKARAIYNLTKDITFLSSIYSHFYTFAFVDFSAVKC